VPTLAGALRLLGLARGVATLPGHERLAAHPLPLTLHILGATGFAVLGALQFSPGLRRRSPAWHRAAGRALAPLGVVGALSGMWLTLRLPPAEYAGPALAALRLVAGSAMAAFLVTGLLALRRRDFAAHGAWMTRAYALGTAAGTQVFTLLPSMVEAWRSEASHALMMGAGWALNAAVAEWVLRRRGTARAGHPGSGGAAPGRGPESMQALLYERYGGPERLRLARVPRPRPLAGQVLVRVHAASLNAMDSRLLRADPFLVRLHNGLLRPRRPFLGADVAGVVETVGPGVSRFAPGDAVFGEAFFADGLGTFAEYACVREGALVPKPPGLGFVEAAAVPLASVTALQAVRERAKVRPGQSVLVQGAGGGVGLFLVQLARVYGAEVTAVCGPGSVGLVRSLGAARVLDYTREGAGDGRRYDAIFGVNGFRPLADYRERLAPGGTYVMVGGTNRQLFEALLLGRARFGPECRRLEVLTLDERLRARDLEEVRGLLVDGRLRVVVDRVFPLARAADAFRYVGGGHLRGKVVLGVREAA
jgi:NADPH:quinone reductase-like Zn-dependent oxidoreductase/uncharacterized membrane protein